MVGTMSSMDFDDLRISSKSKLSLGPSIASIRDLIDVNIIEPLQEGQILKLINGKWTNVDPQVVQSGQVEGYYTASGTGYTSQYMIAHGFGTTPTHIRVEALSPEANDDFDTTADDIHIIITYSFPPPQGTNNLSFYYNVS